MVIPAIFIKHVRKFCLSTFLPESLDYRYVNLSVFKETNNIIHIT